MLNAGRETEDALKPPITRRQNHCRSGPCPRIGPTARLCADAECWTGDGRRLKPPMAHRQNHCRSGPCPRIGSKEKAPANSHLHGLLNKWSEPLSPGCSEESSWTVTVH